MNSATQRIHPRFLGVMLALALITALPMGPCAHFLYQEARSGCLSALVNTTATGGNAALLNLGM
jgi:hypothetical protein